MKRNYWVGPFLIGFVVGFIIFYAYNSHKNQNRDEQSRLAKDLRPKPDVFKEWATINKGSLRLIAYKHNLGEKIVDELIHRYLVRHDTLYQLYAGGDSLELDEQGKIKKVEIIDTLEILSKEFLVERSKLASIIYDFKVIRGIEK